MPKELRVHGVSGTPPGDMLYTAPVAYDLGPDLAKVYEPNRDRWDVRAFHWGSLTSKSSLSAFWILLAPFAMANVAGWMSESPNTWSRIWIRVAGLSLTGIFSAQLANMTLDIPLSVGMSQTAATWLFVVLIVLLMFGLGLLSTQSTFGSLGIRRRLGRLLAPTVGSMTPDFTESEWSDPASEASLTGAAMWGKHSIVHRLRRIHLGFGAAVLATAAGRVVGDSAVEATSVALAGILMVALAFTVEPTAGNPVLLRATSLAPLAGLAVAGWSVASLATGNVVSGQLTVSDELTYEIALVLGIAAGLGLTGELVRSRGRLGWVPIGLLSIATLVGATLGLTGAMLTENYLSATPSTALTFDGGAPFVTLGMLGVVIFIGGAFLVGMSRPRETGESPLRRGVLRSRGALTVAAVYGIVVGMAAVVLSCTGPESGCTPANMALPEWMLESSEPTVVLFGLPFDPTSPVGWAKILMVAVPAGLIVRSIVGGLLNGQDSRRQVGILWDLGSFWPRWFHPLGPPAYGPYAVNRLQTILDTEKPDVLSAHSQGSLISAVALCLYEGDTKPALFVTYGSQLGELYPKLFPAVGFDVLTETTGLQVADRWLNLWRGSDPIGGQRVPALGERNWQVRTGHGHSRYELAPEFCAARKVGLEGLVSRPADAEMTACWDDP